MFRITKFQLYCLLILLIAPMSYIEMPAKLINILDQNAWLALPAALIPGFFLILMYGHIIKKSSQGFPMLLDEHLGKWLGRTLGFIYIPLFIFVCSFSIRMFMEFMKMNVLPATPISVFIGVLLFVGFVAIKTGFQAIARVSEPITFIGYAFGLFVIVVAMANNFHLDRLQPIAYMDVQSFGFGILIVCAALGRMMPVLSLAFFLSENDKQKVPFTMNMVLLSYIFLIGLTTLAVIITLGAIPANYFIFPTFNMVLLARIGSFIQNIDIVFIGIMILGIFAETTIFWFMACYTTQQVFHLRDYRSLAAPSSLIIGVLAILLGRNNLEVVVWSHRIIPLVYIFFFILIPFAIYIVTLFKPYPVNNASLLDPPKDPLNKQGIPG